MVILLMATWVLSAGCTTAPAPTVELAWVASAGGNHIQVIDLATGTELRRVYAGATPWRLALAPDGKRLLAQHWYSATTAVIDLGSGEVTSLLPYRGPGIFTPDGTRYLTFNWPGSSLHELDGESFEELSERVTEVSRVYDLATDPEADTLYLVRYDPMRLRSGEVYSYILGYSYEKGQARQPAPISLRTGKRPVEVRVLAGDPFLLTADHDTNGLSLINQQKAGRAVPTCPAPETVLIHPDETRMVVACWLGSGTRLSQVLSYSTDFSQRPWPTMAQEKTLIVEGGVVAGAWSPGGSRLYLVDRTGARLLEVDPETLTVVREFPTGAEPVDVVVVEVPASVRDRLAAGQSPARAIVDKAIARIHETHAPFADLSWTERATWYEPEEGEEAGGEGEEGEATASDAGESDAGESDAGESDAGESDAEEPEPALVERSRRLHFALKGPGWLRSDPLGGEDHDGGEPGRGPTRLAQEGTTVSLAPGGSFWVTPRQELLSIVLALPNLNDEAAVRHLAGDLPGAPFLSTGLALDVAEEVERNGKRFYVLGAPVEGERISQLWIDADSGQLVNLVEQVPSFRAGSHRQGGGASIIETRFLDFTDLGAGRSFPTRLERRIEGQPVQAVELTDFALDRDLPDEHFSLARLGGVAPRPPRERIVPVPTLEAEGEPGRLVPIIEADYLDNPFEPHPPYNSNPPTSGPRSSDIASWGIHDVPVPLELQVHNLEHGGVMVQYNCPVECPELVEKLARITLDHDLVILAPYPMMEARIALTAWGRIDLLEEFDPARIERFITAFAGMDHHRPTAAGTLPGH